MKIKQTKLSKHFQRILAALIIVAVVLSFMPSRPTVAAPDFYFGNYVVDSLDDDDDANPGDGACNTAASECTLRAAIMENNGAGGSGNISFDQAAIAALLLLPTDIPTITVVNGVMQISELVIIDGTYGSIVIHVDLGLGGGTARLWTCVLTHGYIDINADYRS